jgi:hypothetical protein
MINIASLKENTFWKYFDDGLIIIDSNFGEISVDGIGRVID